MIRLSYTSLLTIDVLHDYFDDGKARGPVLVPSRDTVELMHAFGMLRRQDANRFNLIMNLEMQEELLAHVRKQEPCVLRFWLSTADPYFNSYTDRDPARLDQHRYQLSDIAASGKLYEGDRVSDENLVAIANDKQLPPGFKPAGNIAQALALIEIGITAGHVEAAEAAPVAYKIRFGSRKTTWRYIITNRKKLKLSGLVVVNRKMKSTDLFSGPEETVLPNGDEAFVFTSPQAYALSEKPGLIFQLKKNYTAGTHSGEVLVECLPTPAPAQLRFDKASGAFVSDVYVYL